MIQTTTQTIAKALVASGILSLFVLIAPSAFAQENVNIQIPGISVQTSEAGAKVNVGGLINVDTTKGSTSVSNAGTNVNIGGDGILINTSNGTAVSLGANGENLSVVASTGLTAPSVKAVVSLSGNPSAYIKTDADTQAYNKLVMTATPAVQSIDSNNQKVSVSYKQQGRLFGLFNVQMDGKANVDASGNVSINLPWYSVFVVKNTGDIKTSIKTDLNAAKTSNKVSVSTGTLAPVDQAQIVHVVANSIAGNVSVEVNGENTSVQTGGTSVKVNEGN